MKSEHRRELQTNELGKLASKTGHFLEAYGNRIVYAICAVILLAAVVVYWQRSSEAESAAGWTRIAASRSAEDFANVADQFAGSEVGTWARLREAESHLQNGVRLYFSDRAAGESDLQKAEESFERVLKSSPLPSQVHERALWGMARTLETMSDNNTAAAIEAYESLMTQFPDSLYSPLAEERVQILKTGRGQEFYAWFQQQDPKPEDRDRPQDGLPPGHPPMGQPFSDSVRLPEIPDLLQMPELETPDTSLPGGEVPTDSESTVPPLPELPNQSTPNDAESDADDFPFPELPKSEEDSAQDKSDESSESSEDESAESGSDAEPSDRTESPDDSADQQ